MKRADAVGGDMRGDGAAAGEEGRADAARAPRGPLWMPTVPEPVAKPVVLVARSVPPLMVVPPL